jgi:hypothetical protein
MNSTSFGELYIFRDYSGKCEKNEFKRLQKAPELNRSGLQENTHLEGTRGPHAKAEPALGPTQADRPHKEADRAPPGPDQALLREGSSTAS